MVAFLHDLRCYSCIFVLYFSITHFYNAVLLLGTVSTSLRFGNYMCKNKRKTKHLSTSEVVETSQYMRFVPVDVCVCVYRAISTLIPTTTANHTNGNMTKRRREGRRSISWNLRCNKWHTMLLFAVVSSLCSICQWKCSDLCLPSNFQSLDFTRINSFWKLQTKFM